MFRSVSRSLKWTSKVLNRALFLVNLGNITTLLVRLYFYLQIFELLTLPFVLVRPSSLSCIFLTNFRGSVLSSPPQMQPLLKGSLTTHTNVFVLFCLAINIFRSSCADRDHVQSLYHPRKPARVESPRTSRQAAADNNRDSGEISGGLATCRSQDCCCQWHPFEMPLLSDKADRRRPDVDMWNGCKRASWKVSYSTTSEQVCRRWITGDMRGGNSINQMDFRQILCFWAFLKLYNHLFDECMFRFWFFAGRHGFVIAMLMQ